MKTQIDDRHEVFTIYTSQCGKCKHLNFTELSCAAFPEGIPGKLLSGDTRHDKPIEGQTGNTVFTAS